MKKMLLLAFALVLITCGGAFALNKMRCNAVRDLISSMPGSLAAAEIKADFFGDGVEIVGLSGRLECFKDNPMDISLGFLRLEGANLKAAHTPGQVKLVDKAIVRGLAIKFEEGKSGPMGYETLDMEEMVLDGFWSDYQAFSAAAGKEVNSQEMLAALYSMRYGASRTSKLSGSVNTADWAEGADVAMRFKINMAHAEMAPCSMEEYGASNIRDLEYIFDNDIRLKMDKLSFASVRVPQTVYTMPAFGPEQPDASDAAMLSLLSGEGIKVDGLQISGLALSLPEVAPIGIAALDLDLLLNEQEWSLGLKMDDLTLPSILLGALADDPELYESVFEGRTFVLDSSHNLSFKTAENGRLDISYAEDVREKELGAISDSLVLTGAQNSGPFKVLPDESDLALVKASLRMEDNGLLQVFFDVLGAELAKLTGGSMSPQEAGRFLRAQQMTELKALPMPEEYAALIALRDNVTALLEGQGVLSLSLEPEQPLQLLPLIENPSGLFALPVESSFVPAGKQEQ